MAMNGSGDYKTPMQHLIRTTTKHDTGATDWVYNADTNVYFASVKQTGSEEQLINNRYLTVTKATIRLKGQYLSITALDKLLDLQWNEYYLIDSVSRGEDEWVLEAHKL